jgi:hypothetical protein
VFVADDGDALVVRSEAGGFRLAVDEARIADAPGIRTPLGRSTPCS